MKIRPPTAAEVVLVAKAMRERDLREFLAVSPHEMHATLTMGLAERFGDRSDTYGFYLDDNTPVAVGAMVQHRPNVVTLMFFATDDFTKVATELTKFIVNRLFPGYRKHGVHRIECISIDGYSEVHRWIELLGLQREGEPLLGYGKNRETFIQFAWVADARPSGA